MSDILARPTPPWFDDAKLGIFIHWTASAIPGYAPLSQSPILASPQNEWDSSWFHESEGDTGPFDSDFPVDTPDWRAMPEAEMYHYFMARPNSAIARYHTERFGNLGFEEFVERFRNVMIPGWDPASWANLFARAGARYVVLCTKVEDGFLMWPSAHSNPYK